MTQAFCQACETCPVMSLLGVNVFPLGLRDYRLLAPWVRFWSPVGRCYCKDVIPVKKRQLDEIEFYHCLAERNFSAYRTLLWT